MTIQRLKTLQPGESFVYFTGYLDKTRCAQPFGDVNAIAHAAYDLCIEGKLHLTQRRLLPHNDGFEYIATGMTPRRRHTTYISSGVFA